MIEKFTNHFEGYFREHHNCRLPDNCTYVPLPDDLTPKQAAALTWMLLIVCQIPLEEGISICEELLCSGKTNEVLEAFHEHLRTVCPTKVPEAPCS